jgi:hypothetical protein
LPPLLTIVVGAGAALLEVVGTATVGVATVGMTTVGSSTGIVVVLTGGGISAADVVGFTAVIMVVGITVGAATEVLVSATTTAVELLSVATDVDVEVVVVVVEVEALV